MAACDVQQEGNSGHLLRACCPGRQCTWETGMEIRSLIADEQNKGSYLLTGYLNYPLFTREIPTPLNSFFWV